MNKWIIWAVVIIAVVVGAIWYTQGRVPAAVEGGNQEAAAGQSGVTGQGTVTAAEQARADIMTAVSTKNAQKLAAAQTKYRVAVTALAAYYPVLDAAVKALTLKNVDTTQADAALKDYQVKLTVLQSSSLSLANGESLYKAMGAIVQDIATVSATLEAAAKNK